MSAVVSAVAENARRLLDDAELLYGNGRYRSSTALAVLSIEESGKACLVRWGEEGFAGNDVLRGFRRSHIEKQRILFSFIFAQELLIASKDFYEDSSNCPQIEKGPEAFEKHEDFCVYIWQEFMNPDNPDYLDYVTKRASNRASKYALYAETGAMDYVKQTGFYTDVDEGLEVNMPFGTPDKDEADEAISLAKRSARMPSAGLPLQKAMAAIYMTGPTHGESAAFLRAKRKILS